MRRLTDSDDLLESEIEEAEFELFMSDIADDATAYLAGHISLEEFAQRSRVHRASAKDNAATLAFDRAQRAREDRYEMGDAS